MNGTLGAICLKIALNRPPVERNAVGVWLRPMLVRKQKKIRAQFHTILMSFARDTPVQLPDQIVVIGATSYFFLHSLTGMKSLRNFDIEIDSHAAANIKNT